MSVLKDLRSVAHREFKTGENDQKFHVFSNTSPQLELWRFEIGDIDDGPLRSIKLSSKTNVDYKLLITRESRPANGPHEYGFAYTYKGWLTYFLSIFSITYIELTLVIDVEAGRAIASIKSNQPAIDCHNCDVVPESAFWPLYKFDRAAGPPLIDFLQQKGNPILRSVGPASMLVDLNTTDEFLYDSSCRATELNADFVVRYPGEWVYRCLRAIDDLTEIPT